MTSRSYPLYSSCRAASPNAAGFAFHRVFQPTFGNRPEKYIGRDGVIEKFIEGLREPVGSRNRCTLFLGQRGMGKTALLLELSDRALQECRLTR